MTPGSDSSQADTSSIVNQVAALGPWNRGDAAWNELLSCVRGVFEPYNINVVDQSPGVAPHHEVMVAGTFAEFGLGQPALGVAPLTCSFEPNSLTFVFANEPASIAGLCHAAAQEPGHAWTLDHELLCEDPMTYLTGCGPKVAFQDADAECGESAPRVCECGGATQNSHQQIVGLFGARASDGPVVTFVSPADGADVESGFEIAIEADDDAQIATVEVLANGVSILEAVSAELTFRAPAGLTGGDIELEAIATNVHGAEGSAQIHITLDGSGGNGQNTTDTGGSIGPPREGCGCASTGGGGSALLVLFLMFAQSARARLRNSPSTSET